MPLIRAHRWGVSLPRAYPYNFKQENPPRLCERDILKLAGYFMLETKMRITDTLNKKLIKAVQTSMRIEGYKPAQSEQIRKQAKALMEQRHVQVSVPRK